MKVPKIREIALRTVLAENPSPIPTPVGLLENFGYLTVTVTAEDGTKGIGYARAYDYATIAAALAYGKKMSGDLLGKDPLHTFRLHEGMWKSLTLAGNAGVHVYALSALDVAVWDLKARLLECPLYELLGGARDQVDAYASGLMLHTSSDGLKEEIARMEADGYQAIKMRVGSSDLAQDVARLETVRSVFGGRLMCDAAMAWKLPQARRAVREFEPYDIAWLEDPLEHGAWTELDALKRSTEIPIAGGEHIYDHRELASQLVSHAYEYAIFDTQRIGGVTGWVLGTGLARASGVPVASHVFPEIAVHCLAGLTDDGLLEYLPWANHLFETVPAVADGTFSPPDDAGLGLTWDGEFIEAHCVDVVRVGTDRATRSGGFQ